MRDLGEVRAPLRQIRLCRRDLLEDVGQTLRVAHEIAAGHVPVMQHICQTVAAGPVVHDVDDAEVELLQVVKPLILAQHRELRMQTVQR